MAHQINAGSPVLAGVRAALVYLPLAVLSLIPWHTLRARERVSEQILAVNYRVWLQNSFDPVTHITCVLSHIASASGAIEAGLVLAVVHLTLTVAAGVISRTLAVVCVSSVHTVAAMMTELICLKTCDSKKNQLK